MFLVGKLVCRQEDVRTLPAGPSTTSPLIYLQDSLSSRRFLIDSGASVSVFPDPGSSGKESGVKLLTADGSSLSCSGSRVIPLRFGSHRFEWPFQLAPVAVPILGADFLKHYNLLLDVSNQRVFSADSPTSPSIILPTSPDSKPAPLSANLLATPQCISDLLAEFPDVVSSDGLSFSDCLSDFSDMFRQFSTYSSKLFIHEIKFFRRFIFFPTIKVCSSSYG